MLKGEDPDKHNRQFMAIFIVGAMINILAAITETNLEFEKYNAFAIVNLLL